MQPYVSFPALDDDGHTSKEATWLTSQPQFDDIPLGPIGHYDRADWTNFENVAGNATSLPLVPHVRPYSPPNYAKVPAGKTGVLSFSTYGATLYSLHYACALPVSGVPIGCTATFTAACGTSFTLDNTDTQNVTSSLNYEPSNPFNTTMAYSNGTIGYQRWHGACLNYSVSAVSHLGTPVDLYLDDVLFGVNILCPNYPSGSCFPSS